MPKIKIITDSTAYIDKSFIKAHNIGIVPLAIGFGESIKDEGFPGDFDAFFDRLSKSSDFPTTSQPPVGRFVKVFENALKDGYEIIAIIMSSKLSGAFNSASTAAKIVDPTATKISIIDSLATSALLKFLIEEAVSLTKKGVPMKQIIEKIETQKRNMGARITVSTLEYLKRGGRLSTTEAVVGSLLNIKPIIGLIDGELRALNKVRGKKRVMEKMLEDIPPNTFYICICYIKIMEEIEEYKKLIQKRFPKAKIEMCEIGPVIGSHLGPEIVGIGYAY